MITQPHIAKVPRIALQVPENDKGGTLMEKEGKFSVANSNF